MSRIKLQESPAATGSVINNIRMEDQAIRFKHLALDNLQCRGANGRGQRDKINQIMDAPVASMYKCAVVQARKGWINAGARARRTGYRQVGRALGRHVFSSDFDGEIEAELNQMPDEQILQWLLRARSQYMALVPRRHHAKVLGGFVAEMADM